MLGERCSLQSKQGKRQKLMTLHPRGFTLLLQLSPHICVSFEAFVDVSCLNLGPRKSHCWMRSRMRTQSVWMWLGLPALFCLALVLPIHSTSFLLCLEADQQDLALPVDKQGQEAGDFHMHVTIGLVPIEWRCCCRSNMKNPKRR